MADQTYWADFWTQKSQADTDFQATGRGTMDVIGYLYTVRECARILDLRPEDELLDIGGGTGVFALSLSPFVKSIRSFDISPGSVKRAQGNVSDADNVSVGLGSITDIPVGDESCDKFLAYSVLQYLDGDEPVRQALSEARRTLRPHGIGLMAANPDRDRYDVFMDRVCGDDPEVRRAQEDLQKSLQWFDAQRLVMLAREVGLEATTRPIHSRIWQSFYMFDLVIRCP